MCAMAHTAHTAHAAHTITRALQSVWRLGLKRLFFSLVVVTTNPNISPKSGVLSSVSPDL